MMGRRKEAVLKLLKSAAISMVCYNYFFTQPYHTLAVNNPGYLITFSIMLATFFDKCPDNKRKAFDERGK